MPSWMNALREYKKENPQGEDEEEVRKIMERQDGPKAAGAGSPKAESAMSRVMNNPDLLAKVKEYKEPKGLEKHKKDRAKAVAELEKGFDEIKAKQKGYDMYPKKAMEWLVKQVQESQRKQGLKPTAATVLKKEDYFQLIARYERMFPYEK